LRTAIKATGQIRYFVFIRLIISPYRRAFLI
jgi:hypothetical protein